MLIGWISQMMALLDKPQATAVQHVIEEIAEYYPQALIYPYMISSENYTFEESASGQRNRQFVEKYVKVWGFVSGFGLPDTDNVLCSRLKSILDKGGVVQEFVDALQQLTNPEMLFKVNIPFPLKYPLVDPVLRCQTIQAAWTDCGFSLWCYWHSNYMLHLTYWNVKFLWRYCGSLDSQVMVW